MIIRDRFIFTQAVRGAWLAALAVALTTVLVSVAGCSGDGEGASEGTEGGSGPVSAATDHLQIEQGHLAWGELRLGMTVREAEKRLGRKFGFTRADDGNCRGVTAPVRLHEHPVHVMFDSKEPDSTLLKATVELSGGDLESLLAAVRSRVPGLEDVPGPDAGAGEQESPAPLLALAADPEQAVLAKPAEALTITYTDCLD